MSFDPEIYMLKIRKESIDDEQYYVGRVEEFPDICVYEDSATEAKNALMEVLQLIPALYAKSNRPIPEPVDVTNEYSGRVSVRLSKSNHRSLVEASKREKVSSNQLISQFITTGLNSLTFETVIKKELHPVINLLQRSIIRNESYSGQSTMIDLSTEHIFDDFMPKEGSMRLIQGGIQ